MSVHLCAQNDALPAFKILIKDYFCCVLTLKPSNFINTANIDSKNDNQTIKDESGRRKFTMKFFALELFNMDSCVTENKEDSWRVGILGKKRQNMFKRD